MEEGRLGGLLSVLGQPGGTRGFEIRPVWLQENPNGEPSWGYPMVGVGAIPWRTAASISLGMNTELVN